MKKDDNEGGSFLKILISIILICAVVVIVMKFSGYNFTKSGSSDIKDIVDSIIDEDLDEKYTSISDSLKEEFSGDAVDEPQIDESIDWNYAKGVPVDNPIKQFEDIKNYNIFIESDIEISGAKVSLESTGTVDEENQAEYLKATIKDLVIPKDFSKSEGHDLSGLASIVGSMGISVEMYIDMNSGMTYTKLPMLAAFAGVEKAGEWQASNDASSSTDFNGLLSCLANSASTEQLAENVYRTRISGKVALDNIPSSFGDKKIDPNLFREDIPVVYTMKDGKVDRLSFDFSGLGASMDMTFDVTLSNYNEAGNITIPSNVIKAGN